LQSCGQDCFDSEQGQPTAWQTISWQVPLPHSFLQAAEGSPVGAAGTEAEPCGHGANSQLGPVRPTLLPSGQIFASIVHWVSPPGGALVGPPEGGVLAPEESEEQPRKMTAARTTGVSARMRGA
jgi:hypothetical protein